MASSSSSTLSAAAPLFVPQSPLVPRPTPPMFVTYFPPLADMLPPMRLPNPFIGPPPRPEFACPLECRLPLAPGFTYPAQCQPPPPRFPNPFLCPPPPAGFSVSSPPMWGFPHGPGVGLPPSVPMAHYMMLMARPAAPAEATHAAQPKCAALKDEGKPPAGSGRTSRATSGKWHPKPLPPRMHRAAAKRAVGDRSYTAMSDEPSPRSVLESAFPDSALTLSSSIESADNGMATCPTRRSGPPTARQTVQSRPPARLAYGRGARRALRRPRRRFDPTFGLTTLMIRNIPNGFARHKVMNIIDQHCAEENTKIAMGGGGGVKSEYDFLYVPIDFKSKANKGYCFVNVTSPDAAFRLWKHLHGFRWKVNDSWKMCEIDYANIQSRDALIAHFSKSCFDCETEEFLPVWFSPPRNGARPAVVEQHVVGRLGRCL